MRAYPLSSLVSLRERRVDEAQNALRLSISRLEEARLSLKRKEQELSDYKVWKKEEINRRYDELIGKVKKQEEISKFNHELVSLNIKEFDLQSEIEQFAKDLENAQKAYEKAVQVVNSVQKDLAKLEKHREIWQFQEKRYEEYLADQELDDFKVKKSQDF
ncbi:type III secretion system stalk subunit SctO [Succinatimonas hippei]|uniref:type III secretion system stalk subunit SctO n=1 Tax=Succinatimonas hippei TaxID=626938 RepID=UPI0023F87617|nr:YscO family type III secretion system apparatus protein [Succinatimonas hippei]